MSNRLPAILLTLVLSLRASAGEASPAKEFLTGEEIERIRDAQEIDDRAKIYLEAAELRLKTAQARLLGQEPKTGDPLELLAPEDMIDGYYRILESVMLILDDAYQKPGPDRQKVTGALKSLKKNTEKALKSLDMLKKLAEEKKMEALWDLVNQSISITEAAHDGAELGLSREPAAPPKK